MGTLYKLQKIVCIEESSSNCSCLTLNSLIPPHPLTPPLAYDLVRFYINAELFFRLFINIRNSFKKEW